jgi:nitrile hydratase
VGQSFKVGDRVRVKGENPNGNPRTPAYVKGKAGVIAAVHGVIDNPLDHRGPYPPLYTVAFEIREVFGKPTDDTLWVDVHEEWLERA